jgi:hypothetical protein
MFTEAVREIVDRKIARLDSVPIAFADDITRVQRQALQAVLDALDLLDTEKGLIVLSEANLLRIEQLTDLAREILTGPEYQASVKELMSEFDEQAALTFKYFDAVTDKLTVPEITQSILRERKRMAVESLLQLSDQRITLPMREIISNAVVGRAKRTDLLDAVRLLVVGDKDTDGRLLSASRQIVADSFASADAAVTNEVARQTGMEWYLYTGGLMDTTRPFCKARVGKFFHKSEVQSWAAQDWAGKIPGTDANNIFITRGGYNCQHALLPVSEFAVPAVDRARIKS